MGEAPLVKRRGSAVPSLRTCLALRYSAQADYPLRVGLASAAPSRLSWLKPQCPLHVRSAEVSRSSLRTPGCSTGSLGCSATACASADDAVDTGSFQPEARG